MLREQCCGEPRDAEWPSKPQRAGRQGSRIPRPSRELCSCRHNRPLRRGRRFRNVCVSSVEQLPMNVLAHENGRTAGQENAL